ncbi:MAG TPA: cobalt-precorrin-6A reductase [Stellaceae bacterium]|nr:cobalt-precorrin-6A reductase [Stellaceae bacterium]
MSGPDGRRPPLRLLLLGGTGEAAALAAAIEARFGAAIALTTSLAGRTERPVAVAGDVRIGGFGGAEGLAAYLRAHDVGLLVDATHPFAARISAHARAACEAAGIPRLMLLRPPWRRHPLDRWIEVDDLAAAAALVGKLGRRAFLTIGSGELAAFAGVTEVRFLVRLVEPPRRPLPLRFCEIVLGRGPFTLAEERHLLQRHAIEVMVSKASGGEATEAKLVAAREASLPVIMVRRPPPEPGEAVISVEAALGWIERYALAARGGGARRGRA